MITSIFVHFIGILAFLFFFWRRMKEDYPSNEIFSIGTLVLAGILGGWFIAGKFSPAWFFWSELAGGGLGFIVGLFRFKFRFHESLEAVTVSFLPWISFYFLKDASMNANIISLAGFLFSLILVGVFYVLDVHYKKLTWYRSGRVGFAGLAVVAIFFLVRAAVAALYPHVLTFSGRIDAILSSVVAFGFFLLIYNLSKEGI